MSSLIPAWVDGSLQPADKFEVHRRGLRHKAVSVFVMRGQETLIQRRAMTKYHTPGLWANGCCTHPHWQEPAAVCARRRLAEELGLEGLAPEHRDRVEYRADVGGGMIEHELVDIFTVELPREATPCPNLAEVMALRWITLPDLQAEVAAAPERFTPWLRIYLERHAATIFGTLCT